MRPIDPQKARQFAVDVVEKLRGAGYEALWAGGCVRDQLLGKVPKDYDVATSAEPEQIREVFGFRRTLPLGAAFGVITVLGPRGAGQIEVATFRCDAPYSDGRHPDSVTFSTAEFDAQRRDFTINGLFYDPLADETIDYVGGCDDLRSGIVRAIGDPLARIAEDKLRMLRAIRFTATFDFRLDGATLAAVQAQAHELVIVSAERIAAEMRRMLVDKHRRRAVELLLESNLLEVVLPESKALTEFETAEVGDRSESPWRHTLATLDRLERPTFAAALAALLREICQATGNETPRQVTTALQTACRRWRLTNHEIKQAAWLLNHQRLIRSAPQLPWPQLQRILVSPAIEELLGFSQAVAEVLDGNHSAIDYCRQKLALPPAALNPPPLIDGADLIAAGIPRGAVYRCILSDIRDAQLEGRLSDKPAALARARQIAAEKAESGERKAE